MEFMRANSIDLKKIVIWFVEKAGQNHVILGLNQSLKKLQISETQMDFTKGKGKLNQHKPLSTDWWKEFFPFETMVSTPAP